jgi:hypothetical protein
MTAAAKHQPVNIIKETMIGASDTDDGETNNIIINNNNNNNKISNCNNSNQQQDNVKTATITTTSTKIKNIDTMSEISGNEDSISLLLIDLAQSTPITSTVPAISILPPTPDFKTQQNNQFNPTKDLEITKMNSISIKTESSFDSVEDEEEEPPYIKLKTSLRRFGTMSSLERMPSEDTEDIDKTSEPNSSDENDDDDESMDEMKVLRAKDLGENSQSFRTWTSRAGSFLEESKAFIDKYLGRTEGHSDYMYLKNDLKDSNDYDEYETIEGEATSQSGEEIWGTPTSGGENDEMHMFNNGDGKTVKK